MLVVDTIAEPLPAVGPGVVGVRGVVGGDRPGSRVATRTVASAQTRGEHEEPVAPPDGGAQRGGQRHAEHETGGRPGGDQGERPAGDLRRDQPGGVPDAQREEQRVRDPADRAPGGDDAERRRDRRPARCSRCTRPACTSSRPLRGSRRVPSVSGIASVATMNAYTVTSSPATDSVTLEVGADLRQQPDGHQLGGDGDERREREGEPARRRHRARTRAARPAASGTTACSHEPRVSERAATRRPRWPAGTRAPR